MAVVLACLPAGPALESVARAGTAMGWLLDRDVRGIHVTGPHETRVGELAGQLGVRAGFPVTVTSGAPVEALVAALTPDEVDVAVVGTVDDRPPGDLGRVASALLRRTETPLLVVPPGALEDGRATIRRVLLPLEGEARTSEPVSELLDAMARHGVALTVLHVLDPAHVPAHLDAAGHGLDALRHELQARLLPPGLPLQLRRGPADRAITAAADEEEADLVVLTWSQDLTPGRAAVVRRCLATPDRLTLLVRAGGRQRRPAVGTPGTGAGAVGPPPAERSPDRS